MPALPERPFPLGPGISSRLGPYSWRHEPLHDRRTTHEPHTVIMAPTTAPCATHGGGRSDDFCFFRLYAFSSPGRESSIPEGFQLPMGIFRAVRCVSLYLATERVRVGRRPRYRQAESNEGNRSLLKNGAPRIPYRPGCPLSGPADSWEGQRGALIVAFSGQATTDLPGDASAWRRMPREPAARFSR